MSKSKEAIPDELIPGMVETYRKKLLETTSAELAYTAAHDYLKSNGCESVRRTVQRCISKQIGGAYKIDAKSNSFKVDQTHESDLESLKIEMDEIYQALKERFFTHKNSTPVNDIMMQTYSDKLRGYHELYLKMLSLSPKKTTNTTSIDLGDGGGKIVIASSLEGEI